MTNATPTAPVKKRKRVGMWVFLAVQVVFLIWLIAGASSGTNANDCSGLSHTDCQSASDAGTAIGCRSDPRILGRSGCDPWLHANDRPLRATQLA